MKVSIVIPIYKVELYIRDCLQSVYNQTYDDIELILVNDCSPDNSMLIAKQLVAEKGNVDGIQAIFLEHEYNRGLSAARNTGLNAASGDYVFFLDSDDEITNDCISNLVEPLNKRLYDFVIGNYTVLNSEKDYSSLKLEEGELSGNNVIFHDYCSQQYYMMAWCKLCRVDFLRNNQLFFHEGIIHEDILWSIKVSLVAQSIYAVRKSLYIYKIRKGSINENESMKDKILYFIPVLKLINKALKEDTGHLGSDIYLFYDNQLGQKYINTISHGWNKEYLALRHLDKRPYIHILKNCLKSKQYFRKHGHRLLPSTIAFKVYSMIYKQL